MSWLRRPRARIREDEYILTLDDRLVPLVVRRHPTARRLTLRVDPEGPRAIVTIPMDLDPREGLDMASRRTGWIAARIGAVAERVSFEDGTTIPLGDETVLLRHCANARRGVWHDDGLLCVSGDAAHVARRARDWLRSEARRRIRLLAEEKSARLGRRFGRITIRDTRSRWGSCSARGDLSFCWRLVLAPQFVLDYVVAHEVAHLAEPNHGPRFWKAVATLTEHTDAARAWLRRNGASLRRYG